MEFQLMEVNQLKPRSSLRMAALKDKGKLQLKEETDQAPPKETQEMEWIIH